jgi:alcohol dehydrogenase YqhD (iron-dependent ADH family)
MIDFDFVNPTRIIFGKNSEDKIGSVLSSYHFKRVLLIYGGGSIKKSGLYDKVISKLDEEGIFHVEMGGVTPNPDVKYSRLGVGIARDNQVDCLLAIGGGSVVDCAKSIGVSYYYDGDPFDFNTYKVEAKKCLPIGVILTIASAGSESSNSCVISNSETNVKQGFNNDLVRPLFAIEDPLLTYSVSPYQTAAGITDIMMHSLERYFNVSDEMQLADEWALSLIKNVMDAGKIVMKDPTNYDARATLMLDSSLSHDGLTSLGKKSAFVVHPLEHALSGYKSDITHGAGIAICFLGWAKYVVKKIPAKFARLETLLFNKSSESEEKTAIMFITDLRDFYLSIGMPTKFSDVGLTKKDIAPLANLATRNGTHVIGYYPQPLDRQAIIDIYSNCL